MNVPVDSDGSWTKDLKEGDELFVAEYSSDDEEVHLNEYVVKCRYGGVSRVDDLKDKILCDLVDKRFPKTTIRKQDVSHGFKKTKQEALEELRSIIDKVHAAVYRKLEELG